MPGYWQNKIPLLKTCNEFFVLNVRITFILMKLSIAKANRSYLSVSIAASNLVSGWGKVR